jgi:hypothetical protein
MTELGAEMAARMDDRLQQPARMEPELKSVFAKPTNAASSVQARATSSVAVMVLECSAASARTRSARYPIGPDKNLWVANGVAFQADTLHDD